MSERKSKQELSTINRATSRVFVILENRCTGKTKAFESREISWEEIQHNDDEIIVIEKEAYDLQHSNVTYFMSKLDKRDEEIKELREKLSTYEENDSCEWKEKCLEQVEQISELQEKLSVTTKHLQEIADRCDEPTSSWAAKALRDIGGE